MQWHVCCMLHVCHALLPPAVCSAISQSETGQIILSAAGGGRPVVHWLVEWLSQVLLLLSLPLPLCTLAGTQSLK